MKLKTYLATYLLFLLILFASIGLVSVYLTNSQMDMLKDKSAGQFQAIIHTLARDVSVLWGRGDWHPAAFSGAVAERVRGYARYYSRQNIHLNIIDFNLTRGTPPQPEVYFSSDTGYFILAGDFLPEPFNNLWLEYRWDVSGEILNMRGVQRTLLVTAIAFSLVAAVALYFILSSIFKPLHIIAGASKKIAGGEFGERIIVSGNNELAQVAIDFNMMAERIENQMFSLEEEAKNKQQFVDNFAHEIRTPLTSIYGYAEYMQKVALNEEEVIDFASSIMDESRHMRNIANSLLELATLRDYVPEMDNINVENLFADIAQSMDIVTVIDTPHITIRGQEDLIKSLLLNLCNNAKKAGSDFVELAAVCLQDAIKITVTDNGCGIPTDQLQKIFEPFYRLDKARNRVLASGGVGLGLTLCQRIAAVHGAKINILSQEGNGTKVEILFNSIINS